MSVWLTYINTTVITTECKLQLAKKACFELHRSKVCKNTEITKKKKKKKKQVT